MEILSRINWVDALALILILRTSYIALHDGLSHEIFPLLGSICMIVFSLRYYHKIAEFLYYLGLLFPIDLLNILGFILAAVPMGILLRFMKLALDKIMKVSWHPFIERSGGLLAGIVRGAILTSTVLIVIALIPAPYLQRSIKDKSLTGIYFFRIGPILYENVYKLLPDRKIGGSAPSAAELKKRLIAKKSIISEKENKPAVKY